MFSQIAIGWDDNAFGTMKMHILPLSAKLNMFSRIQVLNRTDRFRDFFDVVPGATNDIPHSFKIGYVGNNLQ